MPIMKSALLILILYSMSAIPGAAQLTPVKNSGALQTNPDAGKALLVKKCNDFTLTGREDNAEWQKAGWNRLIKLDSGGRSYESRFKILYSTTGIYVFFSGEDSVITSAYDQDFGDLYRGDVFEAFFLTEPKTPIYLEYEVNALDKELVLMVPHYKNAHGWIPWHYENKRRMGKVVSLSGGKMESNSRIRSWSAELFFPYVLFSPLENVPPASGTVWNANFYRLDYDSGKMIKWAWSPVQSSFHEMDKFRQLKFE